MSHFLAQVGHESGGFSKVSIEQPYSEKRIKEVFGKVTLPCANGCGDDENRKVKYVKLFNKMKYKKVNNRYVEDGIEREHDDGDIIGVNRNLITDKAITEPSEFYKLYRVKNVYIQDTHLFDYVYSNKLGNGDENGKDGSRFRGRGIIQLTFRNNYNC